MGLAVCLNFVLTVLFVGVRVVRKSLRLMIFLASVCVLFGLVMYFSVISSGLDVRDNGGLSPEGNSGNSNAAQNVTDQGDVFPWDSSDPYEYWKRSKEYVEKQNSCP